MQIGIENNLSLNENKSVGGNNNFLKTAFGIALNETINYGLRKVLPNFLEDQVIEIKDALLNNGIKEGINTAIDKVSDFGKSIYGIFTGNFDKVSQVELAVKRGGLIDEFSKLFDKSVDNIKEKDYIDRSTCTILKGSKEVMEKSLDHNISLILKEQEKIIKDIDKCIERWNGYKNIKDFEKMEFEYNKIQDKISEIIPLEETLQKINELENLHNLIRNRGGNFDLTSEQMELAKII